VFNVNKKSLTSFLFSAFIIILLSFFIPALRNPVLIILKLPLKAVSLVAREIHGVVFYHRNYVRNSLLQKELDALKSKLSGTTEVELENKRLKWLLSLKQESSSKMIAARVIARDPSNWSSAIMVDKGRSSGIKKGSVCVTEAGLAGRVFEVSAFVSKIILINDPSLGVSALDERSRQEGLVSGSLGGFLIMKYLPKDCDVKVNDPVISSGLTGYYPKGLMIGTVVDFGKEFVGLSSYAIIKPSVNLSSLEEVLIIMQ
jgi:rod shape-determining protein MreC